MLRAKPVTTAIKHDKECFQHIQDLYFSAFPRQEQVPLPFLISKTKKPEMKFDAFYDGDEFVGLTYTVSRGDVTYLWYLATRSELRSKGYGAQIMQHLREAYPNNRIVLNLDIQNPNAPDSEICKRRKEFYIRNGYTTADYKCIFNKNKLDIMYIGGYVSADEFAAVFKGFFGPILYLFAKPKMVDSIPV